MKDDELKKLEKTSFSVIHAKEKDSLDFVTAAQPERDRWVLALNALLLCKREKHVHTAAEFEAVSKAVRYLLFLYANQARASDLFYLLLTAL